MDKATYEQLDRLEYKLNKCIEGIGMIMARLEEEEEEIEEVEEEEKREEEVNPDEEYKQPK